MFASLATLAPAQSLKMIADNWAPYTDAEGTSPGFMTEMAQAAIAKAGFTVTYELVPWTRAVAQVKEGKADLLLAVLGDQVKTEGLISCSEPFAFTTTDLYTLKTSTWTYKDISSMEGQSLGAIQDYEYGDELNPYVKKYAKDDTRVAFSTGDIPIQTSIRKLVAGRVTVLVDDRTVVMWHAGKLGVQDKVRLAGTSGKPLPVFMAVSPKLNNAAAVADKIAAALKEFKKTPECAKILAKYGVVVTP